MFAVITAQQIRERLGARPFKPFRVCLSDGTTHDVPHPEFAWVFGNRIFLGIPSETADPNEAAVKQLSILHVTRVEESPKPAIS
ncbi:MAG: hypothetical protein HYY24_17600 [Verrucomicrobia bacterium]|nr:hypothetical protein [Verrucomicrobiota bacterium]